MALNTFEIALLHTESGIIHLRVFVIIIIFIQPPPSVRHIKRLIGVLREYNIIHNYCHVMLETYAATMYVQSL
jgi:hypothetical protein